MIEIVKKFQREDKESDKVYRLTFFKYQGKLYKFESINDRILSYVKRSLYRNGVILGESFVDLLDLHLTFGFVKNNPLHNEMYKAGILIEWDFSGIFGDEDELTEENEDYE